MSIEEAKPSTAPLPLEDRIRRIRYRSWHRGCKETDIILGHFCDQYIEAMSEEDIALFETLLDEDDDHIWRWLTYKDTPQNKAYEPILEKLRHFREYAPL